MFKTDFEYLEPFFCYKGKSSKVSEKNGYFQLSASFQHTCIFKHFLHTKWSFLANNDSTLVKYAYFFARFLEKLRKKYQSNLKGLKILVAKKKYFIF